ncbi:MAG: Clp protease N-terminal domain-containing protein [Actinomycetota bacterium]
MDAVLPGSEDSTLLLSERLKRCLEDAGRRARVLGHPSIGCEHVFLSMLEDTHGWPAELLGRLQVFEATVARLTELLADPKYRWSPYPIPDEAEPGFTDPRAPALGPTPRMLHCMDEAVGCGRSLGHDAISSEHLLLAFAEDARGVCAKVLDEVGVRTRVVEETTRLMTADDYYSTEQCMIVGPNENFLGWPEIQDGNLWIRRVTGKLVRPEDA